MSLRVDPPPKRLIVPYRVFRTAKGPVLRPCLQVVVKNTRTNEKIGCICMVDSGADYNLFPASIAEALKHNLELGEEIKTRGIGGETASYMHRENTIRILQGWPEITVDIAYAKKIDEVGCGLLGQRGFFEHYRVTFDYAAKNFTIEPYDLGA